VSGPCGSAADRPTRYRLEMWVRAVMSKALVASLPVRATRTAVPHESMYWVRVSGERDIAEVVDRLDRSGVQVLDIRAWPAPHRPAVNAPPEGGDQVGSPR
jgi:hypothetical protein